MTKNNSRNQSLPHGFPIRCVSHTALLGCVALVFLAAHTGMADGTDGEWTNGKGGNWTTAGNWKDSQIAEGTDATATFGQTRIVSDRGVINVGSERTLGNIVLDNDKQWNLSSGTLTLASGNPSKQPTLTSKGKGQHFIAAVIDGKQGFSKLGGGKIILSGNNTYTGQTVIRAGNLTLRSNSGLGATGNGNGTIIRHDNSWPQLHIYGKISSAEDISLRHISAGEATDIFNDADTNTLSGAITLERAGKGSAPYTFGIRVIAGTLTLSGPINGSLAAKSAQGATATDANCLNIGPRGKSSAIISGVISDGTIGNGGISLYKTETGILRITAANTYTGSTVVNAGTLVVDNTGGSGTGSGAISINDGATLAGTGAVAPSGSKDITIATNATVTPGGVAADGTHTAGGKLTLSLGSTTGRVTFQADAKIVITLNNSATSSLAITGLAKGRERVDFTGNAVNFTVTDGRLADGIYTLVTFDAANAYTGELSLGSGLDGYNASLVHNANSIQLRIGGQ